MYSRTPTTPRTARDVKRKRSGRDALTATLTSLSLDIIAFGGAFALTVLVGFMGYIVGNALAGHTGRVIGASFCILLALGLFIINAFRGSRHDDRRARQRRHD